MKRFKEQVWDCDDSRAQVMEQVYDAVMDQIWAQTLTPVGSQTWMRLGIHIVRKIRETVGE